MRRNLLMITSVLIIISLLSLLPVFAVEKQFEAVETFDGIGITAESAAAGYKVTGVFRNSPAYGRIKPGDIITKINDIPTRKKIYDWLYYNINKPAGTTIDLEISRMGTWINLKLTTAKIVINRDNVPENTFPPQKISEIHEGSPSISISSNNSLLKKGDSFFVFDGSRHTGYVQVKKISDSRAILKGENLKEPVTFSSFKRLELRYYGCFASRREGSVSTGKTGGKSYINNSGKKMTDKEYSEGKPNLKVESYSLYLDGTRLYAKAVIRNIGNAPAPGPVCTCYFVSRNDKILGQRTQEIRMINPGERKICIFPFAHKVDPSKRHVEFRDNDTRVKIYRGKSSLSPVLLDMECRFEFE